MPITQFQRFDSVFRYINFLALDFSLYFAAYFFDTTDTFGAIRKKVEKVFFLRVFGKPSGFWSFLVGFQSLNHQNDRVYVICLYLFLQSYQEKHVFGHAFRPLTKVVKVARLRKICTYRRKMAFRTQRHKWASNLLSDSQFFDVLKFF